MWKLRTGETVIDRHLSHVHPGVLDLLPEALLRISGRGRPFIEEVVEFDRVIGETICVRTDPGDDVFFATRPNRAGPTRFVRGRRPDACSSVVVVIKQSRPGEYVLITAFIGKKAEPEPWDRPATEMSRVFWAEHALVYGAE